MRKASKRTLYIDGNNRRRWNSPLYSCFLVIGFHECVEPYQPIVESVPQKLIRYCLPEAAPMTPQHQAKTKETTRAVNHGALEHPVRGEEERGWTWLMVSDIVLSEEAGRARGWGDQKDLFAQVYICGPSYLLWSLSCLDSDTPQVNLNPIPQAYQLLIEKVSIKHKNDRFILTVVIPGYSNLNTKSEHASIHLSPSLVLTGPRIEPGTRRLFQIVDIVISRQ